MARLLGDTELWVFITIAAAVTELECEATLELLLAGTELRGSVAR